MQSQDFLDAIRQTIITPYVDVSIAEYVTLEKDSRHKHNIVTIATIVVTAALPILIYACDKTCKWIPIAASGIITVLTSLNHVYNLKYEWQTHLNGLSKRSALYKEWELAILSVTANSESDSDKIISYGKLTESFLRQFTAYENSEREHYFEMLKDLQDKSTG